MLYSLLAQTTGKYREVGLPEAALYALLGFAIVFLGIAFLILIVWLVGKCMGKTNGKKVSQSKPIPKEETAPVAVRPKVENEEISEETVAILTAAIMAYYEQNKPKCEFTVKRIKRI